MFERFTKAARESVGLAQLEARSLRHNYIGTEHLLLALLASQEGPAARVLNRLGVGREEIRDGVIEIIGLGPLQEPDAAALDAIGIDLHEVRRRAEQAFGPGALERARETRSIGRPGKARRRRWPRRRCGETTSGDRLPLTPRAKKVVELSLREALQLGHNYIETEHILLGLLREGEGIGALLLRKAGVDYDRARRGLDDGSVDKGP